MAKGVKTGGRTKGTPNKTTVAVKEAFKLAFDNLGGVDALVTWAADNQTQFYQLYSKLIPTEVEVAGKDGGPIVVAASPLDERL
jgi:UV DNA damage repair endonuclease